MVKEIILQATNSALRIENDANDWAKCYLLKDGAEIFLGADCLDIVAGRLLGYFESPDDSNHKTTDDGQKTWITHLAERHYYLWASKQENGFNLFLHDGKYPETVAIIMEISEEQAKEWIDSLKELQSSN